MTKKPPKTVVVRAGRKGLTQRVTAGSHEWIADEPTVLGGDDEGPDPYALLLGALGACTSMTLRLYADKKGWPLEAITIRLEHDRIHAEDCRDCDAHVRKIDRIRCRLELEGPLDDTQRSRLVEIAGKCPVHRTLTSQTSVETTLLPRRSS
jgi:putative redox protein